MKSLTAIIRQCNQIGATERLVKKGPIKSFWKKKTINWIKILHFILPHISTL